MYSPAGWAQQGERCLLERAKENIDYVRVLEKIHPNIEKLYHLDQETPASLQAELLAPLRVEERFRVEIERLRHKPAEGVVRRGVDRRADGADGLGKHVRAQRHARDDAKAASAGEIGRRRCHGGELRADA